MLPPPERPGTPRTPSHTCGAHVAPCADSQVSARRPAPASVAAAAGGIAVAMGRAGQTGRPAGRPSHHQRQITSEK